MPASFVKDPATPLLLANAWDLVTLKAAVAEQVPRYGNVKVPVTVVTGDTDNTVSPRIHSRRLAATVPDAKLIMLPGVGHMVQYAAPDVVVRDRGDDCGCQCGVERGRALRMVIRRPHDFAMRRLTSFATPRNDGGHHMSASLPGPT
jgi:hypothetical protein